MVVPAARGEEPVWIRVGTLVDGTSDAPGRDAHLVYDARAIRYVGRDGAAPPRDVIRAGQHAPDVEAPEATVVPGLIDAHTHCFLEGGEIQADRRARDLDQPPDALLDHARRRFGIVAQLGLAGVRDAGDRFGVGLALGREYVAAGRTATPYIDSPGAGIRREGRYGGFMAEPIERFATAADAVADRVRAGAARIKIIATGIIDFKRGRVVSPPQMTAAEIAAIVAAAGAHGRQTFAHASGADGIECAIQGGVDSIEHGFFVRHDQLAYMRDHDIAWVPTFAPVAQQIAHGSDLGWDAATVGTLRRLLDDHAASLHRAHERGVTIVAGSDAGSVGVAHGSGLLQEMALMERAGLPALAVIRSATGTSAARFRYADSIGTLARGARARFILTRHSPLETVANLARERTVVFDGAVFEADAAAPAGL